MDTEGHQHCLDWHLLQGKSLPVLTNAELIPSDKDREGNNEGGIAMLRMRRPFIQDKIKPPESEHLVSSASLGSSHTSAPQVTRSHSFPTSALTDD